LTAFSVTLVAGLFALLVYRLVDSGGGTRLVSEIRAGKKPAAPQFALKVIWPRTETWPPRLRGASTRGRLSLGELRGYPTVINFWASWCTPCAAEASRLAESAREHRGRIVFVGVDVNDFRSDARRFLRRHHVNYVSLQASGSSISDSYGLIGLPETYYLDGDGRVVARSVGQVSRGKLQAGLARIG
jgi:cytochrome c biogenesis protein CcmG/thiol:disulfide interchange protein DsbE